MIGGVWGWSKSRGTPRFLGELGQLATNRGHRFAPAAAPAFSETLSRAGNPPQLMQCMEVWGGSKTVDTGVAMAGLDAWVYSKPYGQSAEGGDVYYVSSCATGRITRLLVADVAGHGSAVCDVAASLRDLMRRYVNYLDQGRFVQSMNQQFG